MWQRMLQIGRSTKAYIEPLVLSVESVSGILNSDSRFNGDKSIDDNFATGWLPPNNRSSEQYIVYKINGRANVTKVRICVCTPSGDALTSTYKVYLSDTNQFGTEVASKQVTIGNAWNAQDMNKTFEIEIGDISANYIKIGVVTTAGSSNYVGGIGEFTALGYTE